MQSLAELGYVLAAVLFIFGLKLMAHPRTAVRGNTLGVVAMLLAMTIAMLGQQHYVTITCGLVIGALVGTTFALRVQMTSMPQMVALFNAFGGAASILVAGAALDPSSTGDTAEMVAIAASGIIGAVTFCGSLVAFGKLQELDFFKKKLNFNGQQFVNFGLAATMVLLAALLVSKPELSWLYLLIVIAASMLGFGLVTPIGGADMPVVIALLNAYSGLAAAATGFVITNHVLIISGSLVGASGIILTKLMCKAMNRSLFNVLFGVMGGSGNAEDTEKIYATVRSTSADDVALMLETAQRVVFVPGYGMAVAQAQHAVRNLAKLLEERGILIEYAIHPVAGRMPGHMNVLLAEADVPYEQLIEMDRINPTMETVDVAIVIGANDVVNPVAKNDPESPIAGMPIIDVDKSRTVIVIKRSLSPGFAGIANPLFAAENTLMLFGDGQQAVLDIAVAIKEG